MKKIEEKFLTFVKEKEMISSRDVILAAFSGGPDSLFLLSLFAKFHLKFDIKINAAHINHRLRGKESDVDQVFCEDVCRTLGIPFYTSDIDVYKYCNKNKFSIEEGSRILRYRELNRLCKLSGSNKIFTGHTLDDNAETILFNLFRGSGLKGLMGIPLHRDNIYRPLLNISKEEILKYLSVKNIQFRIDTSNTDLNFKRNLIREKIIPLVQKEINPAVNKNIGGFSEILSGNLDFTEKFVDSLIEQFVDYRKGSFQINLELFRSYNKYICGEVLKKIWEKQFKTEFTFKISQTITKLAGMQTGRKRNLPDGYCALKERDHILIKAEETPEEREELELKSGDSVNFSGRKITITGMNYSKRIDITSMDYQIISGDNTGNIFILRKWKNGDRFIPLGMSGFKNVSDFLTDKKVRSSSKKNELVLLNKKDIVWVVGHRIDERYKVSPTTKKVYKLWTN